MFTYKGRSLLLHVLVLGTFLLPFYFTGCKKVEEASVSNADTTQVQQSNGSQNIDSTQTTDTTSQNIKKDSLKASQATSDKVDDTPAHKLSLRYPILEPILVPKDSTYTGLGTLVNIYDVFSMFALPFAVFLLLLAFIFKMIDQAKHIAWIHCMLAFLFLLFARPMSIQYKILWGYWVCLGVLALLLVHDAFGLKVKKEK